MACKVNWTTKAWLTFESNITYLQKEWTAKEISQFVASIEKKISILSNQPKIGKSRNKKLPHIRFTLVHKKGGADLQV